MVTARHAMILKRIATTAGPIYASRDGAVMNNGLRDIAETASTKNYWLLHHAGRGFVKYEAKPITEASSIKN